MLKEVDNHLNNILGTNPERSTQDLFTFWKNLQEDCRQPVLRRILDRTITQHENQRSTTDTATPSLFDHIGKKIAMNKIKLVNINLGGGAFGNVMVGKIKNHDTELAIKNILTSSTSFNHKHLVREILILRYFLKQFFFSF